MRPIIQISIIALVSSLLIWLWVISVDPEPSISIFILILVPIVFGINLIIALVLWLLKKKRFSYYFLANSILSSIAAVFLFGKGIERNLDRTIDEWKFNHKDSTLTVLLWTETNTYSIMHEIAPTVSSGYSNGTYEKTDDEWILRSQKDSTQMIITNNNQLINFKNGSDTIQLKRIR